MVITAATDNLLANFFHILKGLWPSPSWKALFFIKSMTSPKNLILDRFPLLAPCHLFLSKSSIKSCLNLAKATLRIFFCWKKWTVKMFQLCRPAAEKQKVVKICYCFSKKPCPCCVNPNPCGWGRIWLPKLRTGITPQWLKLRKILKSMYSSNNVSWVYLVKYFIAKNGVFGDL